MWHVLLTVQDMVVLPTFIKDAVLHNSPQKSETEGENNLVC